MDSTQLSPKLVSIVTVTTDISYALQLGQSVTGGSLLSDQMNWPFHVETHLAPSDRTLKGSAYGADLDILSYSRSGLHGEVHKPMRVGFSLAPGWVLPPSCCLQTTCA